MDKAKYFKCPHCQREFSYRKSDEPKKHIKDCPYQYKDPQKRFKARQALRKKVDG